MTTNNIEITTTVHPLRTMTLRFDRSKKAPELEEEALRYYQKIHDRTFRLLERIRHGRSLVPAFRTQIEKMDGYYGLTAHKFNVLQQMDPSNPLHDTVYGQLKKLLAETDRIMEDLAPELIEETRLFFEYEEDSTEIDDWMEELAFPKIEAVFPNWQQCSIDIAFLDHDLEDFRQVLAAVRKLEGYYFDEMNDIIEDYSDLSNEIDQFFHKVKEFDRELLPW